MPKVVRISVVVALVVGAWWLWQSDAAMNAVILFCTAGIVPFTNKVLSPAQMYMVLGAILLLSVWLLFSRRLVRDVRAVRHAMKEQSVVQADAVAAETTATPVVISSAATKSTKSKKTKSATPQPVVVIAIPHEPSRLARAWQVVAPRIWPAIVLVSGIAGKIARRMARHVALRFRQGVINIILATIHLWWRTEPHLRRFDHWLEMKLKQNKDVAAVLHTGGELFKVVQLWVAEVRVRLMRAVEK